MKFVCVCNFGNVRSACAARHLRNAGHEAIAIGIMPNIATTNKIENWNGFSDDSLKLFFDWADYIINLSDILDYSRRKLKPWEQKVIEVYVGKDVWYDPFHPELNYNLKGRLSEVIP